MLRVKFIEANMVSLKLDGLEKELIAMQENVLL
jgi:hypothetical protein